MDSQALTRLIVRRSLSVLDVVPLTGSSAVVGRSASCDLVLQDPAVSRRHARLHQGGNHWTLSDTSQANGVYVNGHRVSQTPLYAGDLIVIRPYSLNFVGDGTSWDRSLRFPSGDDSRERLHWLLTGFSAPAHRVSDVYAVSKMIIRAHDNWAFWQLVHAELSRAILADRCVLMGVDGAAGLYRLAPAARPSDTKLPLDIDRDLMGSIQDRNQGLLVRGDTGFSRVHSSIGKALARRSSVFCVPLRINNRPRLIAYADRRPPHAPFELEDYAVMAETLSLLRPIVEAEDAKELQRRP